MNVAQVHHVWALERHIQRCALRANDNERCVEEEWRPGIAKGYVLFQAPKLVRSQLLKHLFEKTGKLCSIGGGGGGEGGGYKTREVHEHN
jgi:hypothetical protein